MYDSFNTSEYAEGQNFMMTNGQQSVTVNRLALIKAIKEGRDQHRAQYDEAVVDFKAKLEAELSRVLKQVRKGNVQEHHVNVTPPPCHLTDYDDVIEMMEMSVDENITLDRDAFKAYFKNEWSWTRTFNTLNSSYKVGIGSARH